MNEWIMIFVNIELINETSAPSLQEGHGGQLVHSIKEWMNGWINSLNLMN